MVYRDLDRRRARARQRYAENQALREKILAESRAYKKRTKEERKRRLRLRLAMDPEYREKRKASRRATALKGRYGITPQHYDLMLKEQGGACAICGEQPDGHLYVDHCHTTGKVRGLLCQRCNTGLGSFNDDLGRTMGASAYLRRAQLWHEAKQPGFPPARSFRQANSRSNSFFTAAARAMARAQPAKSGRR
jgi:hypothetical protein